MCIVCEKPEANTQEICNNCEEFLTEFNPQIPEQFRLYPRVKHS